MSRQQEKHRWYGMLYRCENPRSPVYHRYGGRGIKVCEAWHDFEVYYADVMRLLGPCPEGFSIDRVNNDGDYEPGNVRWATLWQQVLNRSPQLPRPRTLGPKLQIQTNIATSYCQQIADQLRAEIQAGEYASQLPTLGELRDKINPRPATNTVRKAIRVLVNEGLVETSPRGTFVRKDAASG